MKRSIPIIAVVVLVILLVFVKSSLDKAVPSDHAEDKTQTSQKSSTPPSTASGLETELLPEEFIGSAGAKYKFTIGWYYDEVNQPNPKPLQDALQAVKQTVMGSDGQASAEIVDVDVPVQDRSPAAQAVTEPGIALNGVMKSASSGNPGEGPLTALNIPHVMNALTAVK